MKDGKIGWGIVGCGVIGYWHDRAVRANADRAQVVAYCDTDLSRAEAFNQKYAAGNATTYNDVRALVRDPNVDVISVCTPSGLHLEPVLAAAEAGVHVLCEKPLEITLERIDRMIEAAEKARIKLGVVFQRRTYEPVQRIKRAVDAGEFGKLTLADAYLKFYRTRSYYRSASWRGTWALDGGGALMNQGIHGIDLLLWFAGEVRSVQAKARTLARPIETEDTAVALLEFASGALGVVEGSTAANPEQPMRVALQGTAGSVLLEDAKIAFWAAGGDDEKKAEVRELRPEEAEPAGGKLSGDDLAGLGHVRLVADLLDAVEHDRPPLITPQEGRRSVELILAIYESSRTGKEVVLS